MNPGCGRKLLKTTFVVDLWRIFQEEMVLAHPFGNALLLKGGRVS